MSTNFWFEPGFDADLQKVILAVNLPKQTLRCQVESHRWAKILLDLNLDIDIEVHDGCYLADGDPNAAEGHTWLVIDGLVFDPTAAQFNAEMDSTFYELHEICDMSDLPARLKAYGYAL